MTRYDNLADLIDDIGSRHVLIRGVTRFMHLPCSDVDALEKLGTLSVEKKKKREQRRPLLSEALHWNHLTFIRVHGQREGNQGLVSTCIRGR